MWTGDAYSDFEKWDGERERRRCKRPKCADCGEHIQDEQLYLIGGKFICPECLEENYKRNTEDFIY